MIKNIANKIRGWVCAVGLVFVFAMSSASAQSLEDQLPSVSEITSEQMEQLRDAQERSAEEQSIRDAEAAAAEEHERTRIRGYEITCVVKAVQATVRSVIFSCGETRNRLYNTPGQSTDGTPLSGNALWIDNRTGRSSSLRVYYDDNPQLAASATALALHARETGERVTIYASGNDPRHIYGPDFSLKLTRIVLGIR